MFNFNPYVKLAAEWEVSEFFLISAWSVWQRTVRRPQRLMAEKKKRKENPVWGARLPVLPQLVHMCTGRFHFA